MILDVNGAPGLATVEIRLTDPLSSENSVRLKYLHLPDLPLLDAQTDAISVNSEEFSVPAVSSIQELVNFLDSLSQGGNRVCYVWYNNHEFELCVGTQAITLNAGFAALIKLPTTLAANTCYSSSLYESTVGLYSHYAIAVAQVRGMWNGGTYDEVIAKVRRDGDIGPAHFHYLRGAINAVELRVLTVKKDGTIAVYTAPEIWSIGLEVV